MRKIKPNYPVEVNFKQPFQQSSIANRSTSITKFIISFIQNNNIFLSIVYFFLIISALSSFSFLTHQKFHEN